MKQFKNKFAVTSKSSALLKALYDEVVKLGWVYDAEFNKLDYKKETSFFFGGEGSYAPVSYGSMKVNHFSFCPGTPSYTLPKDWNLVLKLAAEEVVVKLLPIAKTKGPYLVGDTVVLVSRRPSGWNNEGAMDKYLGTTVKITSINSNNFHFENDGSWSYQFKDIDYKLITFKIGDKVIIDGVKTNGYLTTSGYIEDISGVAGMMSTITGFKTKDGIMYATLADLGSNGVHLAGLSLVQQFKQQKFGTSGITFTFSKDKIMADDAVVDIKELKILLQLMENPPVSKVKWTVTFPNVTIGCSTFTYAEIKLIIKTYSEVNS